MTVLIPSPPRSPDDRIHLVMISGHAPPVIDGVGDCTAQLIAELARQRPRWRFTWLTRRPGWNRSPIVGGPGYRVVRPNHTWTRRGIWVACAALRALRPDIVHIQDQIHSFFETDAACRLAEAAPCPVVTTLHEYHVELPSVVRTDALVGHSDWIIANDARNASRCRERTGRSPDACLWSGSPVAGLADGLRRVEADLLSTFGFLNGLKAVEGPLAGLRLLREDGLPLRWRLIGPFEPGSNPRHARMKVDLGDDWIEFAGAVPDRDHALQRMLASSRVMILPYADGASLRRSTLHAAWANGVPVITTPPPVEEPAIVDGENCLLVRETTGVAWASAIRRVLEDRALEDRLSRGSLSTAEAMGWPKLASRHLAIYEELLGATGPLCPREAGL